MWKLRLCGGLIFSSLLLSLATSCEECSSNIATFDLNHPIHNWSMFPGYPDSISFKNTLDDTVTFHREVTEDLNYYYYPEKHLESQGKCAVDDVSGYYARYYNYEYGLEFEEYFYVNSTNELAGSLDFIFEYYDHPSFVRSGDSLVPSSDYSSANVTFYDAFVYFGTIYSDVVFIELLSAQPGDVSKLWLRENYGLIGFRYSVYNWVRI